MLFTVRFAGVTLYIANSRMPLDAQKTMITAVVISGNFDNRSLSFVLVCEALCIANSRMSLDAPKTIITRVLVSGDFENSSFYRSLLRAEHYTLPLGVCLWTLRRL